MRIDLIALFNFAIILQTGVSGFSESLGNRIEKGDKQSLFYDFHNWNPEEVCDKKY